MSVSLSYLLILEGAHSLFELNAYTVCKFKNQIVNYWYWGENNSNPHFQAASAANVVVVVAVHHNIIFS